MFFGKAGIRAICTIVAVVTFMVAMGGAADDPQSDVQIPLKSSDVHFGGTYDELPAPATVLEKLLSSPMLLAPHGKRMALVAGTRP